MPAASDAGAREHGPDFGALLDGCGRGRQHLFPALNRVQHALGWVPPDAHARIARHLGIPRHEVGAVSSFYPHYRRTPPPRLDVRVCCDMACHLRGAGDVLAAAQRLGEDGVEVGTVSCLGQCDRTTAVALNGRIVPGVTAETLGDLARSALAAGENGHAESLAPDAAKAGRQVAYRCDPYAGQGEYRALRGLIESRDVDHALRLLDASALRGLGGAGFPTGRKWSLVRSTNRTPKWTICNADESEPGTIKDRDILENLPELVIEGMMIGAYCVGSDRGIIYLRHEYTAAADAIRREIDRARALGVLGPSVLGSDFSFDLDLFISPGGYICGEETALIEALEGKRAEPRNKPPFPGTHGLFNQPTLINSVETFAFIPTILLNGPEWWHAGGRTETEASPAWDGGGLKFLALSGQVERPGVYELTLGIPADHFIAEYGGGVLGGRALKAFAPGGASSGFLPASLASTPLDFDSVRRAGAMLGTGAVVVVAEGTCMLDLALNVVRFFRNESCGKCVPCGVGTQKLVELLERFAVGTAETADVDLVHELCAAMATGSICGLGQAAPAPILSVLTHFRDEVLDHVIHHRCPSGVCAAASAG